MHNRERLETSPLGHKVQAMHLAGHVPGARLVLGLKTLDIGRAALGKIDAGPHDTLDRQDMAGARRGLPSVRKRDISLAGKMCRSRPPHVGYCPTLCVVEMGGPPCAPRGARTGQVVRKGHHLARCLVQEDHKQRTPHQGRDVSPIFGRGHRYSVKRRWDEPVQGHAENECESKELGRILPQGKVRWRNMEATFAAHIPRRATRAVLPMGRFMLEYVQVRRDSNDK